MKCSESLGRSPYKEKFAFFYREDEVRMINSYQYEEKGKDVLAREPFILRFKCPNTVVQELVLIPVHTKPEDAKRELGALHHVVQDVIRKWKTDNIMILGDFNADGRYLSEKKMKTISICSPSYHWLIDDDVDTTSSNLNDHTYDRIVVYGQAVMEAIVPGSAKSFNFQREFKLTDTETLDISDHYPVEVTLKTSQKQKAPRQRKMALPRTTKPVSTKRQTQKKGPQKKKAEPAGIQKNKKKMTTERKRGRSSDTPAKRRRLA